MHPPANVPSAGGFLRLFSLFRPPGLMEARGYAPGIYASRCLLDVGRASPPSLSPQGEKQRQGRIAAATSVTHPTVGVGVLDDPWAAICSGLLSGAGDAANGDVRPLRRFAPAPLSKGRYKKRAAYHTSQKEVYPFLAPCLSVTPAVSARPGAKKPKSLKAPGLSSVRLGARAAFAVD